MGIVNNAAITIVRHASFLVREKSFFFNLKIFLFTCREYTYQGVPWWSSGWDSVPALLWLGFNCWSGDRDPTSHAAKKKQTKPKR